MYYITTFKALIGTITLACDDNNDGNNLVGLWLKGQKYYGADILKNAQTKDDMPIFADTKKWLEEYFSGQKPDIKRLPLNPVGSDFRKEVWNILCEIPYGQLTTYGKIAKNMAAKMNRPSMSGQAVGGAVGHNPISIIIPCHRVVGSNGSLTGYAGGIEAKIALLELEKVDMYKLVMPKR